MNACRIFAALLLFAIPVLAQDATPPQHRGGAPAGPRIVTMTRPMAVVSRLENELEDALAKGDKAAIDKLVRDDFNLWEPTPAGSPLPRAEWMQQAPKLLPAQRRNLAVEALSNGDVYVASFVALAQGKKAAGRFVVDVWTKAGDSYALKARYQSKAYGNAHRAPRPTGKD